VTPTTIKNQRERLSRPENASSSVKGDALAISCPLQLEHVHLEVLEMVTLRGERVTRGQISKLMSLPADEVRAVTDTLCEMRLLRRLNTIIESYAGAAPTST